MANKRMFAKTIIDSDAFLDMPLSTQSLYFHLSMRADDDGFVNNPKKISRMIGCGEDDLKLLIAKKFLLTFESGVVVIKHWLIHNTIRKDRKTPTNYQDEYNQLVEKENGSYTKADGRADYRMLDVTPNDDGNHLATTWQPDGNQVSGTCPHSIVEISIVEDSIVESSSKSKVAPKVPEKVLKADFDSIWKEYPNKKGKAKAFTSYKKAIKDGVDNQTIINGISAYKKEIDIKRTEPEYVAHGSTWFSQKRWEDDYQTNGKVINSTFAQEAPTTADNIEVSAEEERMYQEYLRKQGKA